VARFYSENMPSQVVVEFRHLGHDVLTAFDAGNANAAVPDERVLAFAVTESRIFLTHNRRHLLRLHRSRTEGHAGIVLCISDPDSAGQAQRIHGVVSAMPDMANELIRVNRLDIHS
jgi:Domain of unknown function (DUF5615)